MLCKMLICHAYGWTLVILSWWFKNSNQGFHLYCHVWMKWMEWTWIRCKWTNGWWSDQWRMRWSRKKANHRRKGAQLGFLGPKGSSKAKIIQTRAWVYEVSLCSFTRLMHNQSFDIRVPQGQGQSTNSNDDLYKSQRIKRLKLRPMDDQMNKQSF